MDDDGPLPKTRRLEPSLWETLSIVGEGDFAPWREEESFGGEIVAFSDWLSPREAEKRLDEELLETLRALAEPNCVVRGLLAGDPLLVSVKDSAPLAKLADRDDVFAVDFAPTALARGACAFFFDQEQDAPICLVEHVNGARAYVGAFRDKKQRRGSVVACLVAALRCSGVTDSYFTSLDLSAMLDILEKETTRNGDPETRRGDETSLELCGEPLYPNARGFLANRDASPLSDDQTVVSLAAACRSRSTLFRNIAERRPRFDQVSEALVAFVDAVLDAKRGSGIITCDALRKQAKKGTYVTGSYIDDEGKFKPLDRKLVEDAKTRLRNGGYEEPPTAGRARDKTENNNIVEETKKTMSSSTALQVLGDKDSILSDEPAAKRQRGGAILKLVKAARPPPPINGPPPPRTADEQHRAAAADCARLELEEEEARSKGHRRKHSLIRGAVPCGSLRKLRLRQLANAIVRRSVCRRASDHLHKPTRTYSALARRVFLGSDSFSDVFKTTTQPVATDAALFKGTGDARLRSGEIDAAVAFYTAAIGLSDHPALYLDRANALLQAGLPHSALGDATTAFVATPGWRSARARLAECLGAVGDLVGLKTLVEFDSSLAADDDDDGKSTLSQADSLAAATAAARSAAFLPIDDDFASAKARGDAAFRAKRHVQAVEAYTTAIRVAARGATDVDSRTLAAAYSNRAAASAALDSQFDALADGIAAATLAPDWVKGHVRTAAALRAARKPRDAIEAYFNALRLLPGDLDLNTGLCDAVEEHRVMKSRKT